VAPVVAEHDPAPAPHVVEDPVGNATVCAVAAAAAVVPEVSFSLGYFYLLFLTYSGVFRFFSGFFLLFAPFFFHPVFVYWLVCSLLVLCSLYYFHFWLLCSSCLHGITICISVQCTHVWRRSVNKRSMNFRSFDFRLTSYFLKGTVLICSYLTKSKHISLSIFPWWHLWIMECALYCGLHSNTAHLIHFIYYWFFIIPASLTFKENSDGHTGSMSNLFPCCDGCDGSTRLQTSVNITPRGKPFDVNQRAIYHSIESGSGYKGLASFCSMMNMPCLSKSAYYKQVDTSLGEGDQRLWTLIMEEHGDSGGTKILDAVVSLMGHGLREALPH